MRRVAGIIAMGLVCATLTARAEEPTAAPSPIEAAKRDYDAIKNANLSLEQQKLELPKTGSPELHLSVDPTPGELNLMPNPDAQDKAKSAAQQRGQRGTNWLVDGMLGDKDKTAKTSLREDNEKADTEDTGERRLGDLTARKLGTSESSLRRGEKNTSAEEKIPSQIINPLDGFLAGWMTPGDYHLLKSQPTETNGGASTPSLPVIDSGSRAPMAGLLAGPVQGMAPALSEPRVNPYLDETPAGPAGFRAPALSPPPNVAPPAPAPLAPVMATPEPTSPKPSATAAANELNKARDDEKYFPQLKRF